jgi:hypothetical protein
LKEENIKKTVWDGMDETSINLDKLLIESNFAAKAPFIAMQSMPKTKVEP